MIKNYTFILILLFISNWVFAQKKEIVKGSKTVTIESREIGAFEKLEVSDNIEVYLDRGEKSELKIEADDNLHTLISTELIEQTLRIFTTKTASKYKKLIVRVTYTSDFKKITSRNDAIVRAIQEIQLSSIALESFDDSKLFLNVKVPSFELKADNDSEIELNLKSEKTKIELSKNSKLKALINTTDLKCDLYQKTKAELEGDVKNAVIRVDGNTKFLGANLTINKVDLIAESYSNSIIKVEDNLSIDASGNSKIELFGDQKIEMKRFTDNVILIKKPSK